MSDVVATPGEASVTVDPTAPKPAPAPEGKPPWLDDRLERERTKFLKDLGVDSLDDAKKAIADLNAKKEAEKTAAQKAAELENSLKATKAEKDAMAAALGAYAKTQMAALNEAQRNAVAAIAGDDPAKQLKTIEALASTWTGAAAPAATTQVVAPPKDTAPAPTAPKDAGNASSPPDPKAIYEELLKSNPVIAARYAFANGVFNK